MPIIDLGEVTGKQGPPGERGSVWYSGIGMTGTASEGTVMPSSGVENARINDMYLNSATGNTYICVLDGDPETAKWAYSGSLKGPTGPIGPTGPSGQVSGNSVVEYIEDASENPPESPSALKNLFGWLIAKVKGIISQNNDFAQSLDDVNSAVSSLETAINNYWQKVYPVGSVYMSVNATNPGNLFGGTWVAWGTGRVPVGINTGDGDFNTAEKTGGAKSVNLAHEHTVDSHAHSTSGHALTVNEIPEHAHAFSGQTSTTGNHAHMYRDYWSCASQEGAAQCVASNSDIDANPGAHTKDNGEHSHTFSGATSNVGGNAAHSHGDTGASAPGTSSALGTQSVLQPYITCYMWKRTA